MSEIFEGRAARWFRTSHLQTATWAEFRAEFLGFFLPPRYFERLEDTIRTHIQGVDETFKEYLVELRTKMQQAGYRKEEELYRIYENMAPEYRLYIRRHEFETLEQLTRMATEYESVRQLTSSRAGIPSAVATDRDKTSPRRTPNPFRSPEVPIQGGNATHQMIRQPLSNIDVQRACSRCGQVGHFRRGCTNARLNFCWDCGRRNILTVDCCRRDTSGNEQRLR